MPCSCKCHASVMQVPCKCHAARRCDAIVLEVSRMCHAIIRPCASVMHVSCKSPAYLAGHLHGLTYSVHGTWRACGLQPLGAQTICYQALLGGAVCHEFEMHYRSCGLQPVRHRSIASTWVIVLHVILQQTGSECSGESLSQHGFLQHVLLAGIAAQGCPRLGSNKSC